MDILLVDTAGRLQTKSNLMEELRKMARVAGRNIEGAPQETLLVLDATTGQNAVSQAKLFGDVVPLTGVVLTKLDGTAKGGVILSVKRELGVPVRWVASAKASTTCAPSMQLSSPMLCSIKTSPPAKPATKIRRNPHVRR